MFEVENAMICASTIDDRCSTRFRANVGYLKRFKCTVGSCLLVTCQSIHPVKTSMLSFTYTHSLLFVFSVLYYNIYFFIYPLFRMLLLFVWHGRHKIEIRIIFVLTVSFLYHCQNYQLIAICW